MVMHFFYPQLHKPDSVLSADSRQPCLPAKCASELPELTGDSFQLVKLYNLCAVFLY